MTAVIYTHSHIDHFGGVLGVVDADTDVPIVAPAGFLEHAVSENVYAGGAMLRRGMYHTGTGLPVSATGTVGVGLGPGTSDGTVGLLAPTLDITHTGQEETLDGVRIVFQITPGTEAPVGDELPLPRPARAVHGRERHPQPAQPPDPARRRGPRRADLVALPRRGDRPVRRRHRRRVRLAPLADLGHRQRRSSS